MVKWVVIWPSLFINGTICAKGSREITNPAACVDEWRAKPSNFWPNPTIASQMGRYHIVFANLLPYPTLLQWTRFGQVPMELTWPHDQQNPKASLGTPHITNNPTSGHGTKRHNLSDVIITVFLRNIINDFSTAFNAEIDIDIWHRYPFRI